MSAAEIVLRRPTDLWEDVVDSVTSRKADRSNNDNAEKLGAEVRLYADLIERFVTSSLAIYHRVGPVDIEIISIHTYDGGVWPTYRIGKGRERSNRGIPLTHDLGADDEAYARRTGAR